MSDTADSSSSSPQPFAEASSSSIKHSSSSRAEIDAFIAWTQAVIAHLPGNIKTVIKPVDLADGVALFHILSDIDPDLFRNPHAGDTKDNWVLTIGTLKRLFKLMMQFYSQILQCAPTPLPAPDLNAIARSADPIELSKLCLLAIGIAVQSEKNESHIAAIQTLDQTHQHQLMMSIESIMSYIHQGQQEQSAITSADDSVSSSPFAPDSADRVDANHQSKSVAQLAAEIEAVTAEKVDIEKTHLLLLDAHRDIQNQFQDLKTEKDELASTHEAYKKRVEEERSEEADVLMRQEMEKLKNDLRRSEDALAELESDNEKLLQHGDESKRKIDELSKSAEEVTKLKDQIEEYRHAADRLQKAENAIEKYKKKLEEGADIRRQLKILEDQNAELVDRNAKLEDEYKRVSAFKPLMDSYKMQIADLETKSSSLQRDLAASKYEQEQILSRLKASEAQRATEKEEMELYQERIKELELGGDAAGTTRKKLVSRNSNASANGVDGLVAADASRASADNDDDLEDPDRLDRSGELEAALSGITMADLKIQVRKLARELEAARANKADQSRLIVLENLLEDAQRMKARYEADYLREHRDKMVLQNQLEQISSGKSDLGDGNEAAFALRLRLNEVVEELDVAKRRVSELEVQNEQVVRELTVAKSDLTLVNKDQVDMLHSLRASMEGDKDELEAHVKRLKTELGLVGEQNRMYMAQVNSLLMEKVDLQAEGIGQRDEALKRERTLGELRTRLQGKGLPKEVEEMVASLQNEAMNSTRDLKALQERFGKAKTFIKQQDKMIKEKDRSIAAAAAAGSLMGSSGSGGFDGAAEGGDENLEREARRLRDQVRNLEREQRLMMSAFQELGRRYMVELESGRNPSGGGGGGGAVGVGGGGVYARTRSASYAAGGVRALSGLTGLNAPGRSWLANQRRTVNPTLQLASRR
ncbi:related to Hook protein [Melanopsichium pennsylvanicum]|uniref:Related to Hook protein n=2 Tax=Melanopsichium pennsylvanicum TaxID=63383 RepID=A0AAJ4XQI3_9BASI|nr:related to Hook protein [Melanopsichium pennsylvanicum 4]SNX86629.1 related to Hook protein [Melanopsichium pennsylvanicum]